MGANSGSEGASGFDSIGRDVRGGESSSYMYPWDSDRPGPAGDATDDPDDE